MGLEIGSQDATSGMTKAIYDQMKAIMEPDLGSLSEEDLENIRQGWRKLSFAIASGVIAHVLSNMEIVGIEASGTVFAGEVETIQTNDGIGHVA